MIKQSFKQPSQASCVLLLRAGLFLPASPHAQVSCLASHEAPPLPCHALLCFTQGLAIWALPSVSPCLGLDQVGTNIWLTLSSLSQAPPLSHLTSHAGLLQARLCLNVLPQAAGRCLFQCAWGLGEKLSSTLLSRGCPVQMWVGGHQPIRRF